MWFLGCSKAYRGKTFVDIVYRIYDWSQCWKIFQSLLLCICVWPYFALNLSSWPRILRQVLSVKLFHTGICSRRPLTLWRELIDRPSCGARLHGSYNVKINWVSKVLATSIQWLLGLQVQKSVVRCNRSFELKIVISQLNLARFLIMLGLNGSPYFLRLMNIPHLKLGFFLTLKGRRVPRRFCSIREGRRFIWCK